jgi:hypothetical protein
MSHIALQLVRRAALEVALVSAALCSPALLALAGEALAA